MTANIFKIDRGHVQRSFFGTMTPGLPSSEHWEEGGHYYQGVELSADRVEEQDGLARKNSVLPGTASLGYLVTGSGEPAQNDDTALDFYTRMMNGTRMMAVLTQWPFSTTARLWLFRVVNLGGGKWQDNRVSIATSLQYANGRLKGKTEISGYVDAYETYTVIPSSVTIKNNKLLFTSVIPLPDSTASNIA